MLVATSRNAWMHFAAKSGRAACIDAPNIVGICCAECSRTCLVRRLFRESLCKLHPAGIRQASLLPKTTPHPRFLLFQANQDVPVLRAPSSSHSDYLYGTTCKSHTWQSACVIAVTCTDSADRPLSAIFLWCDSPMLQLGGSTSKSCQCPEGYSMRCKALGRCFQFQRLHLRRSQLLLPTRRWKVVGGQRHSEKFQSPTQSQLIQAGTCQRTFSDNLGLEAQPGRDSSKISGFGCNIL